MCESRAHRSEPSGEPPPCPAGQAQLIRRCPLWSPTLAPLFQRLDDKSQLAEHPYGAGFADLEVARGQALTGGDFVGGAEDCLVGVVVSTPLADLLRAKFLYLVKYPGSRAGLKVLLTAVVLCSRIGVPDWCAWPEALTFVGHARAAFRAR
jgi:hypothetical protein